MELKEVRAIATRIRVDRIIHGAATDDPPTRSGSAIIILDDRITELEAENEILLRQVIDRENWKASAGEALGRITELEAEVKRLEGQLLELNTLIKRYL